MLKIAASGVNNDHDLTGQVFQRLIADRKYLAIFYTLPPSAALLARLAVSKMDGIDWNDAAAIAQLRIADFACGTGVLLSAVYEQIAARHERAGGDTATLHPAMLEQVIYGCDVMPSAIHITGSTLAGLQPTVGFTHSNLHTMEYGRQDDGNVRIGSLEMLDFTSPLNDAMPDASFDLVIMNPPFTSNTAKERMHVGTFAPAFAAFGNTNKDQRDMSKRLTRIKKGTCYHGHAGMASAFAALAHRKLKPGGVIALVLPLTASAASSWQAFRRMMAQDYADLMFLSIAANGREMSFSSDTDISECLVIGRKIVKSAATQVICPPRRARLISLRHRRPQGMAHSSVLAKDIAAIAEVRQIEDGPFGGTPILVGDGLGAEMLSAQCGDDGEIWSGLRLYDASLAQTAYALSHSNLWLPASPVHFDLKTARLDNLASMGLYDLDIIGDPPQGPFTKLPYSPTATYPALWNHNSRRETRIICEPDSQLQARRGMEAKASRVWATAGRTHLNREFTFGSQALAVSFTAQETIGGRVWPNVNFHDKRFDCAFAVWGNSTLGLLLHWWHSSRQQSSKASIAIRSADALPILDFRALTDAQLTTAQAIFDDFRDQELQPAYLADADPNRALLDRRVVCDLLGFDAAVYQGVRRLAAKWCAEPSVHGGKARPRPAGSVSLPVV